MRHIWRDVKRKVTRTHGWDWWEEPSSLRRGGGRGRSSLVTNGETRTSEAEKKETALCAFGRAGDIPWAFFDPRRGRLVFAFAVYTASSFFSCVAKPCFVTVHFYNSCGITCKVRNMRRVYHNGCQYQLHGLARNSRSRIFGLSALLRLSFGGQIVRAL